MNEYEGDSKDAFPQNADIKDYCFEVAQQSG
jgi:hypothetical protein